MSNATVSAGNLIWIDLEMTGLDPQSDQIIEIATVITDSELNVLAEGPNYAIYQEPELLEKMDEWNTRQHNRSGLVKRIQEEGVSLQQAEQDTMDFVKRYVVEGKSPMCGNTICQDRRFLARLMPSFERYFHYRNLDVSSIKILAQMWASPIYKKVNKRNARHLALSDIHDSIEELKIYREHFFKLES